jgi:hypothetical protein
MFLDNFDRCNAKMSKSIVVSVFWDILASTLLTVHPSADGTWFKSCDGGGKPMQNWSCPDEIGIKPNAKSGAVHWVLNSLQQ